MIMTERENKRIMRQVILILMEKQEIQVKAHKGISKYWKI